MKPAQAGFFVLKKRWRLERRKQELLSMLTVHHLEKSRSHRVLWLLEELGLEYEINVYERKPGKLSAPPELRAIHPLGKSPVITDTDASGERFALAESGAILEWLAETHAPGVLAVQSEEPARRNYLYWMHYPEGSLMLPFIISLVMRQMRKARMPFFARPIAKRLTGQVLTRYLQPQIDTHLGVIEAHLTDNEWLAAGRFTAADVQLCYALVASSSRTGWSEKYPAIGAYLSRLQARPAYQRAIEKGGPVQL
jgi:glutathione S-transferase